jgi:hypothetical protein
MAQHFYHWIQKIARMKRKEKTEVNVEHNFRNSREINAWSVRYNTPIDEIHEIFESTGNSIAKTIAILREKQEATA